LDQKDCEGRLAFEGLKKKNGRLRLDARTDDRRIRWETHAGERSMREREGNAEEGWLREKVISQACTTTRLTALCPTNPYGSLRSYLT